MNESKLVAQILRKAFEAKKKAHTGNSMRNLAKKLDWSAPFFSKVLSGKAPVPLSKLDRVMEVLELDEYARASLREALAGHKLKGLSGASETDSIKPFKKRLGKNLINYDDIYNSRRKERVLSAWYHLPILDAMTCVNFDSDPKSLAKRFGLTVFEVQSSLRLLEDIGLAKCSDGVWEKTDLQINFPTKTSEDLIRKYHTQILRRAILKMAEGTEVSDFEKRLITSSSIAVNSKKIAQAKSILMVALTDCIEVLTEGDCDMVYNLSLVLFPQEQG